MSTMSSKAYGLKIWVFQAIIAKSFAKCYSMLFAKITQLRKTTFKGKAKSDFADFSNVGTSFLET